MRIILQECKVDLLRAVRYRVGMISDLVLFTVLLVFVLQLGLFFVTDTLPTSGSITRITSILPLTRCNAIIREAFTGTAAAAEYIGLLLCSAVCFAVGYAVFEIFLRMAKKKGNLLMY